YGNTLASLARDRYCSWDDAAQGLVRLALHTARTPQEYVTAAWAGEMGRAFVDEIDRLHVAGNDALSQAAVNRCKLALLGVARLATPDMLARVYDDSVVALPPSIGQSQTAARVRHGIDCFGHVGVPVSPAMVNLGIQWIH